MSFKGSGEDNGSRTRITFRDREAFWPIKLCLRVKSKERMDRDAVACGIAGYNSVSTLSVITSDSIVYLHCDSQWNRSNPVPTTSDFVISSCQIDKV